MLDRMRAGGATIVELEEFRVAGMGTISAKGPEVCVEVYVYKPPKNKLANMILH